MNSVLEKTLFDNFIQLYKDYPNTVLFLDRVMNCVYTNAPKIFPVGKSLISVVRDPFLYPLREFTEVKVLIDGEYSCARINPVKNELNEAWLYICELISSEAALSIAEQTDAGSKLLPMINSVEHNLSYIWTESAQLQSKLLQDKNYDLLSGVFAIESALSNVCSVTKNIYEYTDMMFSEKSLVRTDASSLVGKLIERCNAALAKCGRRVDFICETEELTIMVDCRHAVAALVNAVQNALLYSPKETCPTAVLYRSGTAEHGTVVFSISNENIMFTDKDFSETAGVNFSYQRQGYGIPLIKRFAQEAHGNFEINDENGRVTVTLTLPAADSAKDGSVRFEVPDFAAYKTDIPDIVELKMREVAEFFGAAE